MSDKIILKPCPFCGGEAYFSQWGNYKTIYIDCDHKEGCGSFSSGWFNSSKPLQEQIIAWNTRYETKKPIKILGKKTNLWKE